jgi:hypothetical protein
MHLLPNFLFRAVLLVAGVFFALALACFFVVLLFAWALRAAWYKLTGRPVMPFAMRMGPRSAFEEMRRRAQQAQADSRTPRADSAAGVRRPIAADVTDVEPK